MESKDKIIETYLLNTLNEIKCYVKTKVNLTPEREEITDNKMLEILKSLLVTPNGDVKNKGENDYFSLLLPLTDESENNKIRKTLILYYVGLYYDNVDLLNKMLKSEIDFGYKLYDLYLYYLDKDISSKFTEEEYLQIVKDCGILFEQFNHTTKNLPKEDREKYIVRFTKILKRKHDDLSIACASKLDLRTLFTRSNLDIFEDESYYKASKEQFELISACNSFNAQNEDTIKRLNNLIQTTEFNKYLYNNDLMFSLFTDEELQSIDYWIGSYFCYFSKTPELLDKAMDLFKKNRDIIKLINGLNYKTFMEIDNDTLIEICKDLYCPPNEDYIKFKAAQLKSKSFIKRMFKRK